MQSFNCAYIEMWKWQLLHQRILWPVFMDTAGSMILISVFLFAKEVGWEALVTKPYTDTDVLLASNWRTQKQWERWPIALFISLAQTLKCNRFWRYTLDKFRARKCIFFVLSSLARIVWVCIKYIHMRYWPSVRSKWLDISRVLFFFLRFYGLRRSLGP